MMGNQRVLGLHLVFLSLFLVATEYTCLGAQNSTTSCHERERQALLEFKNSVEDKYGMLSSWVGTDCCSWKGVHCDGSTGSVISLHLRGNYMDIAEEPPILEYLITYGYLVGDKMNTYYYLVGDKVNTYLTELRNLQHLDLSGNNFHGSQIPKFIGSFKQLTYLNLSDACFSGIIPHHIGNLSNLKVLDLSSNYYFTPLIANDVAWVSSLSSLVHLDLSYVYLSQAKNIDMVFHIIPSLAYLSLSDCGISNVDFGLNSSKILPNIQHLDLSWNNFEGQLPYFFQNTTSLLFLDLTSYNLSLAWNSLNLLNMIPSLLELHMSRCGLHYIHFSSTYFNSSAHSNIQHLDLGDNSIEGRFPEYIGRLTNLRVLYLNSNSFTGLIPKALERLRSLEVLDLSYNHLNGSIPKSFGRLTGLTSLDLESNRLAGAIPISLGRLDSLQTLSIASNLLTGPIPTSIGRLDSLQVLSIASNLLTGPIPVSVGQLTKLVHLDLSKNSLEGVVSEAHFANLSMLKYLDVGPNDNLIFNISHDWTPRFQLRFINFRSCKIANGFPKWLQTQRKLKSLTLSNVSLHGLLPATFFRKIPMLEELDLSDNKLSGSMINLPFSVYTKSLLLQDNLFSGSLPASLCRSTNLSVIDVSSNRLSGNIPSCVGNLQDLWGLILNSNRLSGVLPSSLGNISSSLAWLKLNNCNFNGEIPSNLGNLISLRVLDLGNNEFSGSIPKWIGDNFKDLVVLRLHKNNFTGGIPQSLCGCFSLQILDIAHNNLKGSIPRCFGELRGMIEETHPYLHNRISSSEAGVTQVMKGMQLGYTTTLDFVTNMDLSSNKLTGEIPLEVTTLALLVGLNLSHNHLSGSISDNIGNMKALNSLDLSDNLLTGMIPPSTTALNFLSVLNLSHNNLSGRIPTGNQLQTLTDPSTYAGNRDLCGAPLPNNCSNHENPPTITSKNEAKKVWFYLDITCGFATGFWGVIGVLSFKKQ